MRGDVFQERLQLLGQGVECSTAFFDGRLGIVRELDMVSDAENLAWMGRDERFG